MELKILIIAATILTILILRYLIIAGGAYVYFWVFKKERWQHRRIQQKFPDKKHIWNEVKWSLSTFVIFMMTGVGIYLMRTNGYTKIYSSVSEYGWPYFFLSIAIMIVYHDAYFYWGHRLMHVKKLFPYLHRVHHLSINPSPWASFSFQPTEALLHAAVLPIIIVILPVHQAAILVFLMYMTTLNVLGHLGYELFPEGATRHWLLKWHNTSTHHNIHHSRVNCNYGLYFNYWDRIMGTNHEKYHDIFDAVKARPRQNMSIHSEEPKVSAV